jgi:hypothetical protein
MVDFLGKQTHSRIGFEHLRTDNKVSTESGAGSQRMTTFQLYSASLQQKMTAFTQTESMKTFNSSIKSKNRIRITAIA